MSLHETVRALMKDGKGVFGSDADTDTLHARFARAGITGTEESRRAYRELLFTALGIEKFVSAVFLPEEAFTQTTTNGQIFPDLLASKNILVGLAIEASRNDTPTRLQELRSYGLAAARKRISISSTPRSSDSFLLHARRAAEFAHASHALNIVPVIGVSLSNSPREAVRTEDAITEALPIVSAALEGAALALSEVVLEVPLADSTGDMTPTHAVEVAERTMRALTSVTPKEIGGILLRSFETSPQKATENLNALARLEPFPWPIAFSFSRILTDPVLEVWKGIPENHAEAQAIFIERLALAQSADAGGYAPQMEFSTL